MTQGIPAWLAILLGLRCRGCESIQKIAVKTNLNFHNTLIILVISGVQT
jgi:hypothetical protein